MAKKTGLFFGSFNPIHVGHLILANFMAHQSDLEQVWFVVSPHNPHKNKNSLANQYDRYNMVQAAVEGNPKLEASNIEFGLPQPSYTIDTLTHLAEKYPTRQFVLIMGGDNLASLHKWKNYEAILSKYQIYVYQRPEYDLGVLQHHPKVRLFDAPQMQISASFIRDCLKKKVSVQYLVTPPVQAYLESSNLYL